MGSLGKAGSPKSPTSPSGSTSREVRLDHSHVPQSPTISVSSAPRSPVGLARSEIGQEQAQKIDLQMNMPTPPGSLSRRRNLESPRDSRNISKKSSSNSLTNCLSSQGPPSEVSSTYTRVDSPELPAIHFRNVKMGGENDERKSQAIQNDLFDSLKIGLDVKHNEKVSKAKKKKDNRSSNPMPEMPNNLGKIKESPVDNRYSLNEESRSKKVLNNEIPPPLPKKQKTESQTRGHGQIQGQQLNNLHSPTSHGRPIVPYQVSNPIVPQMRPTPLVYAGVSHPVNQPIRPAPLQSPQRINPPQPLFFQNPHVQSMTGNDLPSIDEIPPIPPEERMKMNSMLKELGQVVHPSHPNRPKLKTNPHKNQNLNSPKEFVQKPEQDQFVTAVYREPLTGPSTPQKSPVATPPQVTPTHTQKNTPRTTPHSFDIPLVPSYDQKPLTKLPPRPEVPPRPQELSTRQIQPDNRRISTGSHNSSNSSQSTLTPTSAMPLCASIDGKMMSLLPPPPESDDTESKLIAALKRSPSDSAKDSKNHRKSVPQVKRSNSSPKLRPKVFTTPRSDQISNFTSDEDIESNASQPFSENSSVVLLQPIELKLARPAYVRQIANPDHQLKSYIANSDFMSPSMDRQLSRSSDTISSIPYGRQTPKFPLSSSVSTSLTQLLQELASDHPSLDINLNKDILGENDSDIEDLLGEVNMNGVHDPQDDLQVLGAYNMNVSGKKGNKQISDKNMAENKVPGKGENQVQINRGVPNPYQVKRRQNYTIPPRHCRSLDYIPSDREDYVSSNQSSACGSPKQKHQNPVHAYLMPFFSGRNAMGIESISVSSIASSSEMSKSDPALNLEVGSSAYESEYDNYRPGMLSDEDFFIPDPVSDMDIELFDDVNVDNVTVSDQYSIDLPPLPVFPKKKITDV